ncbi:NrfC-like protein, partial [Haemophilus influenzae HK1212]
MTVCSRRNFVSGMGAVILMTGTSLPAFAKENKADKPKRYAMIHDENACIGCTACMDSCRDVNQVPEGVSRLEILRSEPYG